MAKLNATHDPARRSWVESANRGDSDFPIQNLPWGVFRRDGEQPRGGIAIGDSIVDLKAASEAGLFSGAAAEIARAASGPILNDAMEQGVGPASALREQLSDLLRADGRERARLEPRAEKILVPMASARLQLPARIGAYTDFLSSIFHTMRMGRSAVPPSYKYQPIAYNSRASSVRVSGETIVRPKGEFRADAGDIKYGAEASLDFELEFAAFIGAGNALGSPIPVAEAADHIFGFCLLNDWSARGIQRWESQPLGPFSGKSFSTSISPWIVTAEALAPFRAPAFKRDAGDPAPFPHLSSTSDQAEGGFDITLDAYWRSGAMRSRGTAATRVTHTNANALYWTFAQMVAHHTANGCNLRPGDLLASGTVSGPTDESRACIAELNSGATAPLTIGDEKRLWLEDGDEAIFRARAERAGHIAIGFGECSGVIGPAVAG